MKNDKSKAISSNSDPENLIKDLKGIVEAAPNISNVENATHDIQISRDYTLEEIGKVLGVTRERVRQIESKALNKIRHISRRKMLEAFTKP